MQQILVYADSLSWGRDPIAVLLGEHLREQPLPRIDHEPGAVHHVALDDLLRSVGERLNLPADPRAVRHCTYGRQLREMGI
jgi:hypothetical protein